jgi:hypothetical protein
MGSFLSSPVGFERMKEASLEVYPSQATLYKHQKNHALNEGVCLGLYGYFIDDLLSEYKVNSPHDIPSSE